MIAIALLIVMTAGVFAMYCNPPTFSSSFPAPRPQGPSVTIYSRDLTNKQLRNVHHAVKGTDAEDDIYRMRRNRILEYRAWETEKRTKQFERDDLVSKVNDMDLSKLSTEMLREITKKI